MRDDQAIDSDPICGESAKGADLISPDQAAVPFHTGYEDRGELSSDGARFQPWHPRSSIARTDAKSEGL
jgi:hypothetical protein